jgi:DNA-binding NarL/FixJ family response regulator
MDIRMPRLDGIEATRKILQSVPGQLDERRTAVLVLTTFDDEEYLLEAVRTGAEAGVVRPGEGTLRPTL